MQDTTSKSKRGGDVRQAWSVCRRLVRYGRRHWRPFLAGTGAAALVVGARLGMPWPLRVLADRMTSDSGSASESAILMGSAFLGLLLVLGLGELLSRLAFARFSIATVRDFRADALRAAIALEPLVQRRRTSDLVARLIGDAARVKAGLKGFLVHVATNGITLVAVSIVVLVLDPAVGAVMLAAVALVLGVTAIGAMAMFRIARRYREKEGRLAERIEKAIARGGVDDRFEETNHSSGTSEARLTRIQGQATWAAYGIFGIAVVIVLWLSARGVDAGRVAPGDVFVLMMYLILLRGPVARVARQGSRSGKILGSALRLTDLLRRERRARRRAKRRVKAEPLAGRLALEAVAVHGAERRGGAHRLGPIDLELSAGERVAIVGPPGSGKTTLLELLVGARRPDAGVVRWDGASLRDLAAPSLERRIRFVPHAPTWSKSTARKLLGLGDDAPPPALPESLAGAGEAMDARLHPDDLSPGERRTLGVLAALRPGPSVLVVDDPVAGLDDDAARRVLEAVLSTEIPTVVVALSRGVALGGFDRVIRLERGHLEAATVAACEGGESR